MDKRLMQGGNVTPFPASGNPEAMVPLTTDGTATTEAVPAVLSKQPVDEERLREWTLILSKYKAGKAKLEQRVTEAERWWKLRNEYEEQKITDRHKGLRSGSAWLHSTIVSKHADAAESYPQPNIRAREQSDEVEAWALTQIIPCILEQNHFEDTYDAVMWQKLKTGTGIYKVVWDASKLNGMGDITINRVNLLNLFWEPGIENIQDSRMVFHTETVDKDVLRENYPNIEFEENQMQSVIVPKKMPTDDFVSDDNKVVVIDAYYKKAGKLHYCKYVGTTVLYATENEADKAERGLYDHGLYPFVFDTLYPVEGSPAGYGYIDIGANPQTRIDLMNTAMLRNTLAACTPRYFERSDGSINEEEFLDLENTIIHVNGNLGEDSIRVVDTPTIGAYYSNYLDSTIHELRETASNNETANGGAPASVTSASGIAALQEMAGKTSRSATAQSYRSYTDVVNLVIELVRQFYDLPRQFRITGEMGRQKYIQFSNEGMQPQYQGSMGGVDMGYRLPVYDIKVEPQKKNRYSQLAQNELAKELFGMGLFAPQNVDQALMVLGMMDFDGKDDLMQKIAQQGTMYQKLMQYQALAMQMAMQFRPDIVPQLSADITGEQGGGPVGLPQTGGGIGDANGDGATEHPFVEKAREQAQAAVGGGM